MSHLERTKRDYQWSGVNGIEASAHNPQVAENQGVPTDGDRGYAQLCAQIQGKDGRDLSHVVKAWAELPAPLKAAILAIVSSAASQEGK